MGRFLHRVPCTWRLLWLAVKWSWFSQEKHSLVGEFWPLKQSFKRSRNTEQRRYPKPKKTLQVSERPTVHSRGKNILFYIAIPERFCSAFHFAWPNLPMCMHDICITRRIVLCNLAAIKKYWLFLVSVWKYTIVQSTDFEYTNPGQRRSYHTWAWCRKRFAVGLAGLRDNLVSRLFLVEEKEKSHERR